MCERDMKGYRSGNANMFGQCSCSLGVYEVGGDQDKPWNIQVGC
jgi:hypothetical protein